MALREESCIDCFRRLRGDTNPFEEAWVKFMCNLGFPCNEVLAELDLFYRRTLRAKLEHRLELLTDDDWQEALTMARQGCTFDEIYDEIVRQLDADASTEQRPRDRPNDLGR